MHQRMRNENILYVSLCRKGLSILIFILWILSSSRSDAQGSAFTDSQKGKETTMKMQSKIKGTGNPLVLVPGGLTGWISWDQYADKLSATRKVVQVQLINVEYGFKKQNLPEDYTVKTESHALKATLDELGIKNPVDVIAWSYGADVTLDFALDNPKRIRTLTLIEPPALWLLKTNGTFNNDIQPVEFFLKNLTGEITDKMLEQFMAFVGLLQPGQNAREMPQWPLWQSYKYSLRNSPAIVNQTDSRERLRSFEPPVLLVKGTGSASFLHQIIDSLKINLPHAQLIELPGGHAPHLVSLDAFLEKVKYFQEEAVKATSVH